MNPLILLDLRFGGDNPVKGDHTVEAATRDLD
jgi:hypothetical protein